MLPLLAYFGRRAAGRPAGFHQIPDLFAAFQNPQEDAPGRLMGPTNSKLNGTYNQLDEGFLIHREAESYNLLYNSINQLNQILADSMAGGSIRNEG